MDIGEHPAVFGTEASDRLNYRKPSLASMRRKSSKCHSAEGLAFPSGVQLGSPPMPEYQSGTLHMSCFIGSDISLQHTLIHCKVKGFPSEE